MDSIATINSVIPQARKQISSEPAVQTIDAVSQEKQSNALNHKHLQPDQVEISADSRKKLAESEEKDPQALADTVDKAMTKEEVDATSKSHESNESDIDKDIRELSMEILDITIQIQMLEGKENKESVKEQQALEIELAMKKGVLEATVGRKLQMAALSE